MARIAGEKWITMKNVVVTFIPLFNIILLMLISVFKQKYFTLMVIIDRDKLM